MKMLRLALLFLLVATITSAQDAKQFAIMIESKIDDTGFAPQVVLSWQNDTTASRYVVYKRLYEVDKFEKLAEVSGGANTFSDLDPMYGKVAEYKVEKVFSDGKQLISTYAYKALAWDANLVSEDWKTLLILVDNTLAFSISSKLEMYRREIEKQGWRAIYKYVPRVESFNAKAVLNNKEMIKAVYKQTPNLKAILILGRVAIPYSGNTAPDGHGDDNPLPHKGAYPADVFYGDLDTRDWTDNKVSNDKSAFPRQHNYINDGKWDDSNIPSKVELAVGRVDFFDLPFFKESEAEMINNYLQKDIDYRSGVMKADNDAILYDGFDSRQAGYAADGWNNLTSLYGRDNVVEMRVREEIIKNSYEMVYANANGGIDNISDAIYSGEIAEKGYKGIHNMIFGSYNVDWDSESNLLRSIIASKPMALTSVWATRPFWTYFKLGLGETFGEALLSTQNNRSEYVYPSVVYNGGVHIALMGDPTLSLINENVLDSVVRIYENDKLVSINVNIKEETRIYGYQILALQKVVKTILFNESKDAGFIIDLTDIDSSFENRPYIVRPIIKIENKSGRFLYLGNGKVIQ
ncbi:MAG: hypothetical protein CVV25_04565 [Ignavibacteriae bacterium HGW-Ignavibacteriae-4]|nr:MAG: hypothetical protein CVV25_04565 [Ignavibacteriae bacterium HGW-Ignavibacteriae-4]